MFRAEELNKIRTAIGDAPSPEDRDFYTISDIKVKNVYTPLDLSKIRYMTDIGLPGEHPYVRGINKTLYRSHPWNIAQYRGFGSAEETNQCFKELLEEGATGLGIALDLPTQLGLDSDHPLAAGEVGRVGVPISSLRDMELLFEGIKVEDVLSINTVCESIGPYMLALFVGLAHKRGIDPKAYSFKLCNDSLKEYYARGTYIFNPRHAVRMSCDVIEYTAKNLPRWSPMFLCGYHIRESGATAVQELAFTFSNAITYFDEVTSRNVDIDSFAPSLQMFISTGMDFFEEVAKLRAARKVWAKLLKERYGAQDPGSCALVLYVFTAGSPLTAQEPLNNIVRVTLETLAAVCGGAQSINAISMDEALALPSKTAARVALRTQQILAEETGLRSTVDPLGGSYYLESLTKEIEDRVWDYLEKIEVIGGSVAGIESGYFQNEIEKAAHKLHHKIETGEQTVVGVNKYGSEEKQKIELFRPKPEIYRQQVQRLHELRERRDSNRVQNALGALHQAAKDNRNIVPSMIEAVISYATLGEIYDVLRQEYGTYTPGK